MQTSILARFGIRSHSVKGKDYLFRNGDEHDFRYSNVAIVNRYNGVEQIEKNGRILYKTRIHINGNYTIGTYTSENEAAIAYNRAIDLLAEQLPDFKNYTRNYIEGLSHIEYASIYNTVKISRRFRRYIEQLGPVSYTHLDVYKRQLSYQNHTAGYWFSMSYKLRYSGNLTF